MKCCLEPTNSAIWGMKMYVCKREGKWCFRPIKIGEIYHTKKTRGLDSCSQQEMRSAHLADMSPWWQITLPDLLSHSLLCLPPSQHLSLPLSSASFSSSVAFFCIFSWRKKYVMLWPQERSLDQKSKEYCLKVHTTLTWMG